MIYEPADDSFLLAKIVKKHVRGKKFLDMGSGSGIQSENALQSGALSVLATDIDAETVSSLKKKGIPAVKSDLFSNVDGLFDVIAFNPPYLPWDAQEDQESRRVTTGGKQGDEVIVRFLAQASKHLTKKGAVLLLVSSLTPKKRIFSLLKKQKMKYIVVDEEKLFFERLEVWKIVKSK